MSAMLPSHEHEYRSLWHDEVRLSLECDFDRGFAEEQCVVAHFRLHREVLHVGAAAVRLPGFVVHAGGLGHRGARPAGDDPAALDLPALERRGGQVEADIRALLALLGSDQHTVANDY